MICVVVLPSFDNVFVLFFCFDIKLSGRFTGEELCFKTLILPSLNRISFWFLFVYVSCRGDSQGSY